MKYTLYRDQGGVSYWNGKRELPSEIHVIHSDPLMAEFELLAVVCRLHGHVTAFDLLTGAENGTEKDTDLTSVLTAFQRYLYPRMPQSLYTGEELRLSGVDRVPPNHSAISDS